MIYEANSEERERLIAGLRKLADFLGQNRKSLYRATPTCWCSRPPGPTRRRSPKST